MKRVIYSNQSILGPMYEKHFNKLSNRHNKLALEFFDICMHHLKDKTDYEVIKVESGKYILPVNQDTHLHSHSYKNRCVYFNYIGIDEGCSKIHVGFEDMIFRENEDPQSKDRSIQLFSLLLDPTEPVDDSISELLKYLDITIDRMYK